MEVLAIKPGTQVVEHGKLKPGMMLTAVGGNDVTAMTYAGVIDLIRDSVTR